MTTKHIVIPNIFSDLENYNSNPAVHIIMDWLTKSEQKILRKIIYEDIRGRFGNITLTEIMRDLNIGSKHTVINALKKLEKMKIISKVPYKNSYSYHVNPDLTMILIPSVNVASLHKTEKEAREKLPLLLETYDLDDFFRVDLSRMNDAINALNEPKRCSEDTKTVQIQPQNGAVSCPVRDAIYISVNLTNNKNIIYIKRHDSDAKIILEASPTENLVVNVTTEESMDSSESINRDFSQGEKIPAGTIERKPIQKDSVKLHELKIPEPPPSIFEMEEFAFVKSEAKTENLNMSNSVSKSKPENKTNNSHPERLTWVDPKEDYMPIGNEWVDENGYIHWDDEEEQVEVKAKNVPEPSYVDVEDDEDDGSGVGVNRRPKWSLPDNPFEKRLLDACHRKYFRKGEKSRVKAIEKAMISIRINPGNPPKYPTEFVEEMIKWAIGKNKGKYAIVQLPSLLSAIEKEDNRTDWLSRYRRKELGK